MARKRKNNNPTPIGYFGYVDERNLSNNLPKTQEEYYQLTHPKGATGEQIHEQESYKISRRYLLQAPDISENLFHYLTTDSEIDGVVISGLKNVSETDLLSISHAIGKALYNQSHTARNEEYNTGLYSSEETDKGKRGGFITTSIIDLCRDGYGIEKPTSKQKAALLNLIKQIDRQSISITLPNKEKISLRLFAIMGSVETSRGITTYVNLAINPIFCGNIKTGYGLFPQDATYRMSKCLEIRKERKTPAHVFLMQWLSSQRADIPKSISLDNLLEKIKMTDYYRENRKKAEKKLDSLFAVMRGIGLLRSDLSENPVRGERKADGEPMFTFYINPDWSKPTSSNLLSR